ncbi:MAG: SHD1 domain-containing protein [Thermoguttaceae bacterium]
MRTVKNGTKLYQSARCKSLQTVQSKMRRGILLVIVSFISTAAGGEEKTPAMRIWTSADGKFHIVARLAEVHKEAVVLAKENGSQITVPRAKLSRLDLDYVERQPAATAGDQPETTTRTPRDAGKSRATIPGADNPQAFTAHDFRKRRLEYGTRIYREAYLKVGKKDPAWDAAAVALLDAVARSEAYRDLPPGWVCDKPSDEGLRALAAAVREKGCDDPLVFSIYAGTLATPRWSPALTQTATRMIDELRQRHYPPLHAATLACKVLALSGNREDQVATAALLDSLAAAACTEDFQGIDRRFVLKSIQDDLAPLPGGIHRLAVTLAARAGADPWIASILMGEVELALGIRAKYPDRFSALLNERLQDPRAYWQAAERHFIKAWQLHRDYPEPAVLMMPLAEVSAAPENDVRLWFDRATAAQFDWTPAYTEMRQHLLNRGDSEALYAFGVECLKTGRYDTDIPWRFLVCLFEARLLTGSDASWRRRDVYANIREFFRGNAQDPRNKNMDYFSSQEALFAYCAGHFQDARAALDKVGDRLDKSAFMGNAPDLDVVVARTYALTGPLAAQAQAMEKAADSGQAEKVIGACRQMLATLDRADKARPYFRDRLVTAEIEAKFVAGQWVPIQPDADLAGWTARFGQWSVDDQGRLVGTWNPKDPCAAILLCHAKLNPNFELTGHAEVVASDGGAGFGGVLSYRNIKSFWECVFYPAVTGDAGESAYIPEGNQVHVRCAEHDNKHDRPAKVARSDDFCVQVFDGRVSTTVGAEIQRDTPPFVIDLDHDPPSGDVPFGVCVKRGLLTRRYAAITNTQLDAMRSGVNLEPPARSPAVVRFTGLKVRKMTKPPAQVQVPVPE